MANTKKHPLRGIVFSYRGKNLKQKITKSTIPKKSTKIAEDEKKKRIIQLRRQYLKEKPTMSWMEYLKSKNLKATKTSKVKSSKNAKNTSKILREKLKSNNLKDTPKDKTDIKISGDPDAFIKFAKSAIRKLDVWGKYLDKFQY